jgi:RNA polymerase sigma-70 factor (ECF subfamily)
MVDKKPIPVLPFLCIIVYRMVEKESWSLEAVSIIAMIRAGSVDAFAQIIEHYQVPIIRYLYRLTGDYETAQDLAQETFIQAYKGILKTNSELRLKAWLYRIATNNARQYHRRRKLLSFIPFDEFRKSGTPNVDNQSERTVEEMTIQEALCKVPSEQRACLVLHYVEGFKYREIAETLGISEDAVRKRVQKGKQIFQRIYSGGEVK